MFVFSKIVGADQVLADWYGFSLQDGDSGCSFIDILDRFIAEKALKRLKGREFGSVPISISPTANASEAVACLGHFIKFQLQSQDENNNEHVDSVLERLLNKPLRV